MNLFLKKIDIIIPTFNRKEYLKVLLSQLYNQKGNGFKLEIVVVVDGSTDGTLEMLKKYFPQVHIVKGTGNWWYTKSMNEGFKYSEKLNPDYVLTLNDDIEINENYIQNLLDSTNKVEENSIIGSASFTYEKPHRIFTSGVKKIILLGNKSIHYYKPFTVVDPQSISGVYPTKVLPGRGMLIPINILKSLNYFDDILPQYHSDTDFCHRATKKNHHIYICWDAQIFSHIDLTSRNSSFIQQSFFDFIKGMFNRYSKSCILNTIIIAYRNQNIFIVPIAVLMTVLSRFKNYFFKKKFISYENNNKC